MLWQLAIVGLIAAGAACYLIRKSWKTWSGSGRGCGGGCGCSKASKREENGRHSVTLIPAGQLQVRSRDPGPHS